MGRCDGREPPSRPHRNRWSAADRRQSRRSRTARSIRNRPAPAPAAARVDVAGCRPAARRGTRSAAAKRHQADPVEDRLAGQTRAVGAAEAAARPRTDSRGRGRGRHDLRTPESRRRRRGHVVEGRLGEAAGAPAARGGGGGGSVGRRFAPLRGGTAGGGVVGPRSRIRVGASSSSANETNPCRSVRAVSGGGVRMSLGYPMAPVRVGVPSSSSGTTTPSWGGRPSERRRSGFTLPPGGILSTYQLGGVAVVQGRALDHERQSSSLPCPRAPWREASGWTDRPKPPAALRKARSAGRAPE